MKKTYAFGTFVMGLASAVLIAASMGTETWTETEVIGSKSNPSDSGCRATRTYGLFKGFDKTVQCLGTGSEDYSMFDENAPVVYRAEIQYAVIAFSILAILSSVMAIFVSGYNLVSRPYETYAGPVGMLIYFSVGLFCALMAVILYVALFFTDFQDSIPQAPNCGGANICIDNPNLDTIESTELGYSFYLLVGSLGTFLLGVILVLFAGKEFTKKMKNKCCPGSFGTDEFDMDNKNNEDGIMY